MDKTVVHLSGADWLKVLLFLVAQWAVMSHYESQSSAQNERRFTYLETTQAQLVKVADRFEAFMTGRPIYQQEPSK